MPTRFRCCCGSRFRPGHRPASLPRANRQAAVRAAVPRGLEQGPVIAGGAALVLWLSGVMAAAFGFGATGLALVGLGAFAAQASRSIAALAARLRREAGEGRAGTVLASAGDVLAGVTLWFGLAPFPAVQPLAVLGPVAYALTRLAARGGQSALAAAASDRASVLLALALAAAFGLLPQALACLALGLCAALLLRGAKE
jgi:hypothetical protein